jgi:hypothetical protein
VPFAAYLFDVDYIVENSDLYKSILMGLESTKMDKVVFANTVLQYIRTTPEQTFLQAFQVSKDVFLEVLTKKVFEPLLEQ